MNGEKASINDFGKKMTCRAIIHDGIKEIQINHDSGIYFTYQIVLIDDKSNAVVKIG